MKLITDAYDAQTSGLHNTYNTARSAAAEADGFVREYVGVGTSEGLGVQ
jgi:hypothetical protein